MPPRGPRQDRVGITVRNSFKPVCLSCQNAVSFTVKLTESGTVHIAGQLEGGGGCKQDEQTLTGTYTGLQVPLEGWLVAEVAYKLKEARHTTNDSATAVDCTLHNRKVAVLDHNDGLRTRVLLINRAAQKYFAFHSVEEAIAGAQQSAEAYAEAAEYAKTGAATWSKGVQTIPCPTLDVCVVVL